MKYAPLVVLLCAPACGQQQRPAAFAVQHASASVTGSDLNGNQVWEFFSERWKKNRDPKFHVCARTQQIDGLAEDRELTGCEGCEVYAVRTTELQTDCDGEQADALGYAALTHFALGAVPADLVDDDPYPGDSLGWYLSWDGRSAEAIGFAYAAELDGLDDPDGDGLVFLPARVWRL